MNITELFTESDLKAEIAAGHVRQNDHPDLPLTLYNYTETAQYEKAWNPVTRVCRGLIVNAEGEILARPFPKFFNHGETTHQAFREDEAVTVTDKLDGSLGIIYPAGDSYAVATRGSFTSDQAKHATALLCRQYPDWKPPAGVTVLFEIIYPDNRIVLDYGEIDDLVLLGGVAIDTGLTLAPREIDWPGATAEVFTHSTYADALAAPPRKNAEGMVVHFRESDVRVKIKQDDYVYLHRIVTGWNERTIWERLAAGETLDLLIDGLPDEFHRWATEVAANLTAKHQMLMLGAESEHLAILRSMPDGWGRKDYALIASKHSRYRPALFQLLDGRDITRWAWKELYPRFAEKDAS